MTVMVAKLDDIGKPAWIALMVLGFILFWPIGLGILAYLIWSGRMGFGRMGGPSRWHNSGAWGRGCGGAFRSSGNTAYDEYREETLKRLEEEQREFTSYLDRLRRAKDKAEFDQFMAELRGRRAAGEPPPTGNGGGAGGPAPA